jgi:hypothetical protein
LSNADLPVSAVIGFACNEGMVRIWEAAADQPEPGTHVSSKKGMMGIFFPLGHYYETAQIILFFNNNHHIGYFMPSNYFQFNFQPKEQNRLC